MYRDHGLLLLDLDRTLLDTVTFVSRAAALICPDDPGAFIRALAATATGTGRSHTHNLAQAAASLGLTVDSIADTLTARIHPDDLLYPDARNLLNTLSPAQDVAICTFGDPDWQAIKLAATGLAERYPAAIVTCPKREAIPRHWPGRTGWLVDDKPDQRLPGGWKEVWLDRHRTGNAHPGATRIVSLADVPALLPGYARTPHPAPRRTVITRTAAPPRAAACPAR